MSESSNPRWEIIITPAGEESTVTIRAYAEDVLVGELVQHVAKALVLLSQPAGLARRVLTVSEVSEMAARQKLLQEHPAERLFVKDGRQLWLSEEALETYLDRVDGGYKPTAPGEPVEGALTTLGSALGASGWTDAGRVPEGVSRACDYLQSAADVLALL